MPPNHAAVTIRLPAGYPVPQSPGLPTKANGTAWTEPSGLEKSSAGAEDVPLGFPFEVSASGTAKAGTRDKHELDLAGALPGSMKATVTMYPSPLAAMTKGMEGMIREPGGCFEQTSSSNYPNVMIMSYLASNDAADAALVRKTQTTLDHGYKILKKTRTSPEDVFAEMARVVRDWAAKLESGHADGLR